METLKETIVRLYSTSSNVKSMTQTIDTKLTLIEGETTAQKKKRAQRIAEEALVEMYRNREFDVKKKDA